MPEAICEIGELNDDKRDQVWEYMRDIAL